MYIGREKELEVLAREATRDDGNGPRLFYVRAADGMGSRSLFTQLSERLRTRHSNLLWLQPPEWNELLDVEEMPELLLSSLSTPSQDLLERIQIFRSCYERSTEPSENRGEEPESGTSAGLRKRTDAWVQQFQENILQNGRGSEATVIHPQLFLVIPHYDRLPVDFRQWWSFFLGSLCRLTASAPQVCMLLSGAKPFVDSHEESELRGQTTLECNEILLNAFSPQETREMVVRMGLPEGEAADIHEKTEGIPSRILDEINLRQSDTSAEAGIEWAAQVLQGLPDTLHDWVCYAAILVNCTREALSIFCGREEAEEALHQLRQIDMLTFRYAEGGARLDYSQAEALRRWMKQHKGDWLERNQKRAQAYLSICERIGEEQHRAILGLLSTFHYFNPGLLQECLGNKAEEALLFVREHPDYFSKTQFNICLAPGYVKLAQQYRLLLPPQGIEALEQKVAESWKRKSRAIANNIAELERRMEDKEKSAKDIDDELQQIGRNMRLVRLDAQRRRNENLRRQVAVTEAQQPASRRFGLATGVEVFGCTMLFSGIFFEGEISFVYVLLGLGCIIGGAFMPLQKVARATVAAAPVAAESTSSVPDEEALRNMRILNLKKTSLENRRSSFTQSVKKYSIERERLQQQLSEPYSTRT